MNNILRILAMVLLVLGIHSQRGGGGGGRSSGGRSGGSRGSRGSRSRGYARSRCVAPDCSRLYNSCVSDCDFQFPKREELNRQCVQECTVQYGQGYRSQMQIVMILIIVAVILLKHYIDRADFAGLWLRYWARPHSKFLASHRELIKDQQYSQVELDQYFQSLIRPEIVIKCLSSGQRIVTKRFKIQGEKVSNEKYLYAIRLRSEDAVGSWSATGYIGFNKQGTRIWFSKVYDNREEAGQTGKWWTLIYQGSFMEGLKCFEGRWYFQNFESSSVYSGTWSTSSRKHK